jgi:hypothetical protein
LTTFKCSPPNATSKMKAERSLPTTPCTPTGKTHSSRSRRLQGHTTRLALALSPCTTTSVVACPCN